MGRLLESLRADSGIRAAANVANVANPVPIRGKISGLAGLAEPAIVQSRRLLDALRAASLPESLLSRDDAEPWQLAELDQDGLLAYLRALDKSAMMDAGQIPPGYSTAVHCQVCGPVWLGRGAPARVIACPWCFRRKAGKAIPRPPVACGDCVHRLPDPINPEGGMGGCGLDADRSHWPMQLHPCAEHQLIERGDKT